MFQSVETKSMLPIILRGRSWVGIVGKITGYKLAFGSSRSGPTNFSNTKHGISSVLLRLIGSVKEGILKIGFIQIWEFGLWTV